MTHCRRLIAVHVHNPVDIELNKNKARSIPRYDVCKMLLTAQERPTSPRPRWLPESAGQFHLGTSDLTTGTFLFSPTSLTITSLVVPDFPSIPRDLVIYADQNSRPDFIRFVTKFRTRTKIISNQKQPLVQESLNSSYNTRGNTPRRYRVLHRVQKSLGSPCIYTRA